MDIQKKKQQMRKRVKKQTEQTGANKTRETAVRYGGDEVGRLLVKKKKKKKENEYQLKISIFGLMGCIHLTSYTRCQTLPTQPHCELNCGKTDQMECPSVLIPGMVWTLSQLPRCCGMAPHTIPLG